jgi:hypothetical protein
LRREEEQLLARKAENEETIASEISVLEENISYLKKTAANELLEKEETVAELKAQCEKLAAEKIAFEKSSAQEVASLSGQEELLTKQIAEDKAAAAETLAKAESRLAAVQAEIEKNNDSTKEMLSSILLKIEKLEKEKDAQTGETASYMNALQARLLQFADDLLQSEMQAAERVKTVRQTAFSLVATLQGDEEMSDATVTDPNMDQWLATLQQEADQLLAEKTALEKSATGEVAVLRAKITSLEAEKIAIENALARELEALHLEADAMAAQKAAAEMAAEKVLADIAAEVAHLAEEKVATEKRLEEKVSAAKDGVRKLSEEKAAVDKQLEQKSRVLDDRTVAEAIKPEKVTGRESAPVSSPKEVTSVSPPPVLQSPEVAVPDITKASDDSVVSANLIAQNVGDDADPFAFLQQEGAFDFGVQPAFNRKSSGAPVPFAIDKTKTCVSYQHPDDVLEIYKSLNRTRVAREDNTTVTCDAYVFSVKENGVPQIYIAFYLVDSQEVMVYVPEKQPAQDDELSAIMSDGFDFIEIVGFMMDPVELGNDSASRKKKLDKIPVLQRTAST